jgi:hypothetical protein
LRRAAEVALYHTPGTLAEPKSSHKFSGGGEFYERSQEVIENKGPDFSKAKRCMKTNELTAESQEVIDGQRFIAFSGGEKTSHWREMRI